MNKTKQSKPGFTQKEWQALPREQIKIASEGMGARVIGALLPLAERFMTSGEPEVKAKGGDMNSFPLKDSSKGCLLTNANAVKSAKYEELANGNHRITIVLNNEVNPEPYKKGQAKATSNIGNMFFVLGKSDIDNELQNNNMVKLVIKEANYSLTYRDCKATLEFNPQTQQIVSLKHYVNAFIDMKGRIIVLGAQEGTAVLEMFYEAYGFKILSFAATRRGERNALSRFFDAAADSGLSTERRMRYNRERPAHGPVKGAPRSWETSASRSHMTSAPPVSKPVCLTSATPWSCSTPPWRATNSMCCRRRCRTRPRRVVGGYLLDHAAGSCRLRHRSCRHRGHFVLFANAGTGAR
jgi:hypothetical protein